MELMCRQPKYLVAVFFVSILTFSSAFTFNPTNSFNLSYEQEIELLDHLMNKHFETITTRSCGSGSGPILGSLVCIISKQVQSVLDKVCDIQMTVSSINEKVCVLESVQEELIDKNISEQSVFDQIVSISDEINEKLCNTQMTSEEILAVVETINDEIIDPSDQAQKAITILDNAQSILDGSCTLLEINESTLEKLNNTFPYISSVDSIATSIESSLDIIQSIADFSWDKISRLPSLTDNLVHKIGCDATPIFTATTISASGPYCLTQSVTGGITISANDVLLDLNGHTLSNTGATALAISSGYERILIKNGTIGTSATGISIASNTTNISIQSIQSTQSTQTAISTAGTTNLIITDCAARNALVGITIANSSGGSITQCDMSFNTTGLQVSNSSRFIIDTDTFTSNTLAGLSMVSATANCITNCTALENGTSSPDNAFGFVSTNGSENIFSNCIADATQTTTTNYNNIAAGFALLGTEQCSKIVDCCASNALSPFVSATIGTGTETQQAIYSALPCGIVLESISSKTLITTASINPDSGLTNDQIYSVNWSPDGKYLAVGGTINGTTNNDLWIYQFDPCSTIPLITVASINPDGVSTNDEIYSVNWSPDGKYLAIGGYIDGTTNNDLWVYRFDPISSTPLVAVASINPYGGSTGDYINSVNWSADGKYLAVGGLINPGTGNAILVYQFDPTSNTPLVVIASINPDGGSLADTVQSVNWSPDGKYLAAGGFISGTTNNDLWVYQFDPTSSTPLVAVASINPDGVSTNDVIYSVNWSPDGTYLAVGGEIQGTTGNDLWVYQFDPTSSTPLVAVASINPDGGSVDDTVRSVNWSPDGKYLAVGGLIDGTTNRDLWIYQFDPASSTPLIPVVSISPDGSPSNTVFCVNWSPDGTYLAVGGAIAAGTSGNDLWVYRCDQNYPQKNFLQNNTVYCNTSTSTVHPRGVGISGSSIQNCIIGNTAYNNPFNYTFVTNVYTQLLSGNTLPSPLQNISLIGCQPICTPDNTCQQLSSILNGIRSTQTTLEHVTSIYTDLSSLNGSQVISLTDYINTNAADILSTLTSISCAAISITTPTTINTSGIYCLANSISGGITINAANVTLNLNEHLINNPSGNGITVSTGIERVSIRNGRVQASQDGIALQANTKQIKLDEVSVSSCIRGLASSGTTSSSITHCDFSLNTTGVELTNCSTINIYSCTASHNGSAGFSLISSSTNCITECTAFANGISTSANGFGFVSQNGSANIFSNCAADATQTTTTNFANVAAGFALLGTEQCSKIVDCSSCNAFGPLASESLSTQTLVTSARPHGVYLEPSVTLTSLNVGPATLTGSVRGIAWSPNNKFIAIADGATNTLTIFEFNSQNNRLTLVTSLSATFAATAANRNCIDWSPDGTYLAIGVNTLGIRIFEFNPYAATILSEITTNTGDLGQIYALRWSPDGKYIVTGGIGSASVSNNDILLYAFNPCASCPTPVLTQLNVGNTDTGTNVNSVDWSPDGSYIAIGAAAAAVNELRVYRFDPIQSPAISVLFGIESGIAVNSVNWHPTGAYLAVGTNINASASEVLVYQFDSTAITPLELLTSNETSLTMQAVSWSPDGRYLATGSTASLILDELKVFEFNPSLSFASRLNLIASANQPNNIIVRWSPNGSYIGMAFLGLVTPGAEIYSILNFPQKNLLHHNTVSCNTTSSTTYPRGVGISGSSTANGIIGNTAYNNPLNYTFVTNTFTQLLNGTELPSSLQNSAFNGCQPICQPINLAQEVSCMLAKTYGLLSSIDTIASKLGV